MLLSELLFLHDFRLIFFVIVYCFVAGEQINKSTKNMQSIYYSNFSGDFKVIILLRNHLGQKTEWLSYSIRLDIYFRG